MNFRSFPGVIEVRTVSWWER